VHAGPDLKLEVFTSEINDTRTRPRGRQCLFPAAQLCPRLCLPIDVASEVLLWYLYVVTVFSEALLYLSHAFGLWSG